MAFEHLGFYREYYIADKFIGSIMNVEKDRDEIGYAGRRKEILSERIILSNQKTIKANTEVTTMLYPLCGKITQL